MTEPPPIEILRASSLFGGLSETSLAKVVAVARTVVFRRGAAIFREGDPCPGIFVVARGAVRVYKLAPSGKEHVLHVARSGRSFGEVAVFGDFTCPAHAEAAEDSVCALVPYRDFRAILEDDHAFCLEMIAGLARRVKSFVDLLEDIVLRDATARVAHHLIRSDWTGGRGDFRLSVRKKDLASHLNLTGETLSRVLRRLAEGDLIETSEHHLHILDLDRLRRVAEGLPPADLDGEASAAGS